jgi:hypothetical protein
MIAIIVAPIAVPISNAAMAVKVQVVTIALPTTRRRATGRGRLRRQLSLPCRWSCECPRILAQVTLQDCAAGNELVDDRFGIDKHSEKRTMIAMPCGFDLFRNPAA